MKKPRGWRARARPFVPPVLLSGIRQLEAVLGNAEWEYLRDGWPGRQVRGWDDESVVRTQLARWPEYVASVQEPHEIGRSPESSRFAAPDYASHNTAMAFGYVLMRAAADRQALSMLDWGGGLGQYAVLARALAPSVHIEYHCRDLPLLVRGGRTVLPTDSFYESDGEALARQYDLVVASSSLQYVRDWRTALHQLSQVTSDYLYVTRQPFVTVSPSFVVLQRPHRYGYKTEYPCWFINRDEFLDSARAAGLRLLREFLIWEQPYVARAPEQAHYRGFLFAPERRAG